MAERERDRLADALRALLAQLRKEKGLTQADLAAALGRTQTFVSNYERGQRRVEVADFILIARALRLDPSELLARIA